MARNEAPNSYKLMEEEPPTSEQVQNKVTAENDAIPKGVATKEKSEQERRQSERIRKQGAGGMKIADKAALITKKNNLEGTPSNMNSFTVLSNSDLVSRAGNMGVDTNPNIMAQFDVIKSLEEARANLVEKQNNNNETLVDDDTNMLSFEGQHLLEWRSDISDDEGFIPISSRRKKNKRKKSPLVTKPQTRGKDVIL